MNRPVDRPSGAKGNAGRPQRHRGGRPRSSNGRRNQLVYAAALVLAVPVLVWAGVRLADRDGGPAHLAAGDPGVAHVHGLGVDPADGSLYVATHYGTFRLGSSNDIRRVGDSYQDTMGFTVAGPNRFLGSGHPDVAGVHRGLPTRLGLIESTDAGTSWRDVSLSGEVDFHGLAFAHDRVYGWDSTSGRFMVSTDRRNWETRSALPLRSFAVDPDDADHIVGAGPDGLVASQDGGRTWTKIPGPALAVLSWDRSAGLVGATPDGDVHRSGDRGATWAAAGRLPGSPQALLATATTWYAAADENGATGIYRSDDSGRSWSLHYRDAR